MVLVIDPWRSGGKTIAPRGRPAYREYSRKVPIYGSNDLQKDIKNQREVIWKKKKYEK